MGDVSPKAILFETDICVLVFGFQAYRVDAMNKEISVQLLKLVNGERLLRLEHPSFGFMPGKAIGCGNASPRADGTVAKSVRVTSGA